MSEMEARYTEMMKGVSASFHHFREQMLETLTALNASFPSGSLRIPEEIRSEMNDDLFRYSISDRDFHPENSLGQVFDSDEAHEIVRWLTEAGDVHMWTVLDRQDRKQWPAENFVALNSPRYKDSVLNAETLATILEDVPERIVMFLKKNSRYHYKVNVLLGETLEVVSVSKYLEHTSE